MTQNSAFLLALSLLASSPALAADNRIRTLAYDADGIVAIVGHPGIQSTIQFGPDERIENVAVGDSSAWQVTPNRRGTVLFVKPLASVSATNMTVVTDRRTYMFDLSTGRKAGSPLYALKFTYPDIPPVTAAPASQANVVMASATLSPTASTSPESLNFDWKVKGFGRLRPERMFDDGVSLYLSWASDIQLPAILTASEKGREAPLDYRIAGDYIVITPVPQNIVLRYGSKAATAWTTRQPRASVPPPSPSLDPGRQQPESIASGNRYAASTALASLVPQRQAAAPVAQRLAAANSVSPPDAADLLNDKLTDGRHDH